MANMKIEKTSSEKIKILMGKIEECGIRPGSRSLQDYEVAKKFVQSLASGPGEYDLLIRKCTDLIKCEL